MSVGVVRRGCLGWWCVGVWLGKGGEHAQFAPHQLAADSCLCNSTRNVLRICNEGFPHPILCSGGVGMNLTGADNVIFYDSDWNPAMDAQVRTFPIWVANFPWNQGETFVGKCVCAWRCIPGKVSFCSGRSAPLALRRPRPRPKRPLSSTSALTFENTQTLRRHRTGATASARPGRCTSGGWSGGLSILSECCERTLRPTACAGP